MNQLTVVFDLDGTLVDSAPDLIDTLNFVLRREGLAEIPAPEARRLIGAGVRTLIERALTLEGVSRTPAELTRLYDDYLAHYADHIADRTRPFPGLEEALDALARRDFKLAICTNKLEPLARRLLDVLGLSARFSAICGPDTFGVQKPDPDVLLRTVAAVRGDPRAAVMVGDSGVDIATARAAQVPVVAVDFGYTPIPVAELGADRVIGHFGALVPAIDALFPQPA